MRVAAIDLGSNSFHLLVVDASADGHFVPLARDKEILRLGDMVSREGRVTEAGLAKAIDTIHRFKSQADGLGVGRADGLRHQRHPRGRQRRRGRSTPSTPPPASGWGC